MKLVRTILLFFVIFGLVFGVVKTGTAVASSATSFNQISMVQTATNPFKGMKCAVNSDFKKVKKGQSVKKVAKILHSQGKITTWRLVKDKEGVWRLRYTRQYRRCLYLLSEKSYNVAFVDDPDLERNHIITMVSVRKWKLPL